MAPQCLWDEVWGLRVEYKAFQDRTPTQLPIPLGPAAHHCLSPTLLWSCSGMLVILFMSCPWTFAPAAAFAPQNPSISSLCITQASVYRHIRRTDCGARQPGFRL